MVVIGSQSSGKSSILEVRKSDIEILYKQTDRQAERIMNYFWPLHHNDMHSNSVITNCLGLAKCVSYKWDFMCWTWIWDQKSWKIRSL
jgi:hypothetical protein